MATYCVTEEQENKAQERDRLATFFKAALQPLLLRLDKNVQVEEVPKPLTPDEATSTVKEYLADERYRIQLADLSMTVGDDAAALIVGPDFPVSISARLSEEDIQQRIEAFKSVASVAQAVLISGCYFGNQSHERQWIDLLQRVANPQGERSGNSLLLDLRQLPALILLYSGGIAALASEQYSTTLALLTKPNIYDSHQQEQMPLHGLSPHRIINKETINKVMNQGWYAPMSEYLFQILREPFQFLLRDDRQYQKCFDRFEYLKSLLSADLLGEPQDIGSFGWRWKYADQDVMREIEEEEKQVGRNWPPYQAGWFQGQRERFMAAKQKVGEVVARLGWQ